MNDWVSVELRRGPIKGPLRNSVGLVLNVKARTEVEDFMRKLAGGRIVGVAAYGAEWIQQGPEELQAYVVDDNLTGKLYTLTAVGSGLTYNNGRNVRRPDGVIEPPSDKINLSFLRLVGISQNEEGVSFGLDGIFSTESILKLKADLPAVIKQFLNDYLVPMSINLSIVSRNL